MKAMILAAGRGERMRPLTDRTPKPLLLAGGKPLIEHTLEKLVNAGITDIVINYAHLGEQIQQHLGRGERFGARIQYSAEIGGALETGGGIYQALPLLGVDPFIVVNGDIWSDFPFAELPTHLDTLAHMVLVANPTHHPDGDFALQNKKVITEGPNKLTFSGIGVYCPELFASCRPGRFGLIPLLKETMSRSQVSGEFYAGEWMDIGTPERLQQLDKRLSRSN